MILINILWEKAHFSLWIDTECACKACSDYANCPSNGALPISFLLFTRGQYWPPGIVVSCVSVCVYQSLAFPHDNSSPVQARFTKFGQEKQNTLVKIPIVFWGAIDIDLQGQI